MKQVLRFLALAVLLAAPWGGYFNQVQAQQSLPYNEGFEDYSSGLPTGWTKVGDGTVTVNTSYVHNGTKSLKFSGSTSNVVALPTFEAEINTLQITIFTRPEGTYSSSKDFDVGYITDVEDAETFVTLATYNYADFSGSYLEKGPVSLSTAPAGARIAFRHRPLYDSYYWFVDDIVVETIPTCPKPTLSNIVATTNATATITWTPGDGSQTLFDIYWSTTNSAPTSVTPPGAANQSGTSYTISGLDASTDYYVWIRGNCGTEGSPDISGGWTSAVSFKTKCDPTDLPYGVIDFNSLSDYAMPDCWTMVAGLADGTYSGSGVYPYSSPRGAKHFRFGYGATNNVVTLAPLSVEANTTQIEFYAMAGSSSYNALEVGYLTNSADASTFVAIRTLNASEYTSYPASAIKVLMTSAPNGATIAFRFQTTSSYQSWYIDDVTIGEAPSCVDVTPGATTDITSTGATLHWTTTNAATTTYTITDGDAIDVTTAAGATSHPLTGLTPGTTYSTLTITANCGGSDHSDPVNVPSFSTAYGVPFAESFGTSLPSNWKMYTGEYNESTHTATLASGSPWNFGTANGVFDNHARANIYNTGCYKWLVTPGIVMEDNVQITFDLALTKFSGSNQQVDQDNQADDKFIVLVTTDNGETWTVLRKWDNAGSSYVYNSIAYSATGQTEAIDLSAYAGQTVKIAFYGESTVAGGDNNIHIDNVSIDYIPNCAKPTGLAKANVAAHTVDLSWTENGTAIAWQICINDDMDHLVDATTNPYTLTGLDPETPYTVKVRANCGGSNGVSQWSNEVSFTTTVACPAPTIPSVNTITAHTAKFTWIGSNATPDYVVSYRTAAYTEGFEEEFNTNSIPTGWTRYSGLVDDVIAGTALASGTSWTTTSYALGSYNAKLNIYGTSCKHWLVTPEISIESGYSFSFDLALTDFGSSDAIEDNTAQSDDRFVVLVYADDAWTILREWNNSGSTYVYNDIATDGESVNDIDISGYVGKTVKFAFYGESTASGGDNDLHIDNVAVGIAHDAGTWQTVDVDDSGDDTPAAEKVLTNLAAETKYDVKVKANCTASSDGYSLETSNVSFTTLAGDQKPTNVSVDPVTLSSSTATVSWTGNGCSDHHVSYDVYYATSDVAAVPATPAAPNLITGVTETSKTITGLAAETEYNVWVRDNCGTDGVSEWTAAVTFTTLANCPQPTAVAVSNIGTHVADVEWTGIPEYTVKYRTAEHIDGLEEDLSSLPSGWTNGSGALNTEDGTATITSGSNWSFGTNCGVFDQHAYFNMYNSRNYWLITPSMTISSGDALSFDVAYTKYSSGSTNAAPTADGPHKLFVLISTDAKAHWTVLREWNNTGSTYVLDDIAQTGQSENIDLSAYNGEAAYIAFLGVSSTTDYDNNIHIDNVTIGTSVPAGTWSTIEDVDANSITLTGLDAGTKYDVVIEPECNTTLASDPVSFTTVALPTLDITANSWYAIASPVHNSGNDETVAGVDNLIATSPVEYDFLRYVEASCKWESYKQHTADFDLEQGRGYIYRRSADATLVFDGEPNRGNVNVNITMDADGWNLVGNPYMKKITRNNNFAGSSTAAFTTGGYRLSAGGTWTAIYNYSDIAVGEAVLLKATTAGTLTLTAPAGAKKSASNDEGYSTIAFTVSNDEFTDIAYARFSSEEGLPKISHLNPEAPMLSIDGYAIANLNEGTESFPMSFSGQGSYTLTVSGNTDVTGYLHLLDRLTGRDIDLLSTPSYSFTGSPVSDRFTVKLTPDANEGNSTTRFAIFDGNSLIVNGEGTLEVYDVMGRRLMSAEVTGSEYRIPGSDLHTGVYVLRMNGNSQKIVIK